MNTELLIQELRESSAVLSLSLSFIQDHELTRASRGDLEEVLALVVRKLNDIAETIGAE